MVAEHPTMGAPPPRWSRERFRLTLKRRDALAGLLFISPQALGYLVFILGPLVSIFWFSLHDWNIVLGNFDFIGLDNYRAFSDNDQVARVARNSAVFALGYVPLTVGFGLAVAMAVNSKLRAMKTFRIIYFLPVVISLAAWTIVWRLMLQPDGPLNAFLQLVGVEGRPWLRESGFAMLSVIVVQFFKTVGFSMILFLAGLQAIPRLFHEAAQVDGASEWKVFRHITLPLLAPFTFLVTILITISSIRSFALIFLLTNGGPGDATTMMSFYIYQQGLQFFQMGFASALAVALFLAVLILTVAQFIARRRWNPYED